VHKGLKARTEANVIDLRLLAPLIKGDGAESARGGYQNSTNKAIHSSNISRAAVASRRLALATP
ncbi:MAG: hypothetical protein P9L94_18860, partial [Candidatus Hinthialibacter antarcticus]|nr:hypothetical protein [Candidatus Hinthialibacter antarcticus]